MGVTALPGGQMETLFLITEVLLKNRSACSCELSVLTFQITKSNYKNECRASFFQTKTSNIC